MKNKHRSIVNSAGRRIGYLVSDKHIICAAEDYQEVRLVVKAEPLKRPKETQLSFDFDSLNKGQEI
ncbi:hypothetical protein [Alicyclobacillus fodiniaquatilis]|uniref:Uncharacterized protein n=1 Tax=Alicyclobacillus fodiniaquatilis TaxID=1661150 RepID=A0ABW4JMJ2_9BACL